MALGLSLFMLSACAYKPIAQQYREAAKAEDLTFAMVLQNPDAYVGDVVLWGGIIVRATVIKGGTRLIVLETPLGGNEKPRGARHSQGRFIAMSSNFLEPALYKAGSRITLAGQVDGKRTLPLGETTYTYPVVTIKQLHLWRRPPRYVYPYAYPYDYYWGWGPYWDWGPGYYGDFDQDFHGYGEEHEDEGRPGDRDRK